MVNTGRRTGPQTVVVHGRIVGMPDAWGNRLPVDAYKEMGTTDKSYLMFNRGNNPFPNKFVFIGELSNTDGSFDLVSPNHPVYVPHESLFIDLTNQADLSNHRPQTNFRIISPQWIGGYKHYEIGTIQAPWRVEPNVVSSFKGRKFAYPADFANALAGDAGPFRGPGSLEIFGLDGYPEIEDLFKILERESKGRDTGVVSKMAKELTPVLGLNLSKIRSSNDVFRMALERCSDTRFNTLNMDGFKGPQLGNAIHKAFGGRFATFTGFNGRAAFCAFVYAAGALESGLKVHAAFGPIGNDYVISVVVS